MTWHVLEGDCVDVLERLDAGSVQTCVTSPPYWGLRDYGTASWDGGDPECDHKAPSRFDYALNPGLGSTGKQDQASNAASDQGAQYRDVCGKCGAKRIDSQLGLEPTPEQYVANLVRVFREVRRVLRDDGTVWLNLGDSYAGAGTNNNGHAGSFIGSGPGGACKQRDLQGTGGRLAPTGLKPKDLVGIPWRVAFALQADGWWLRSDIIWSKPNPMPESVTDRPTRAHEYVFLLTKSARYFYDADAVREPHARSWDAGNGGNFANVDHEAAEARRIGQAWNHRGDYPLPNPAGRNRRSVWTVTTQPYSEAHFATFPPKLVEPCVLAGSPPGSTVLDPFAGAGTTGLVATQHGRDFIGVELNPEYAELARERIRRYEANPAGYLERVEEVPGQMGLM